MVFPHKLIAFTAIVFSIVLFLLCGHSRAAPAVLYKECRRDYERNQGEFYRQNSGASYCDLCLNCNRYDRESSRRCARLRSECGPYQPRFKAVGSHCSRLVEETVTSYATDQTNQHGGAKPVQPEGFSRWLVVTAVVVVVMAIGVMAHRGKPVAGGGVEVLDENNNNEVELDENSMDLEPFAGNNNDNNENQQENWHAMDNNDDHELNLDGNNEHHLNLDGNNERQVNEDNNDDDHLNLDGNNEHQVNEDNNNEHQVNEDNNDDDQVNLDGNNEHQVNEDNNNEHQVNEDNNNEHQVNEDNNNEHQVNEDNNDDDHLNLDGNNEHLVNEDNNNGHLMDIDDDPAANALADVLQDPEDLGIFFELNPEVGGFHGPPYPNVAGTNGYEEDQVVPEISHHYYFDLQQWLQILGGDLAQNFPDGMDNYHMFG